MLSVRMILGPCIGTSLYTNVLQYRQQHYITRFAHEVDRVEAQNAASYDQTVRGMRYQGKKGNVRLDILWMYDFDAFRSCLSIS